MPKKFNIALTPTTQTPKIIILSQKFSPLADHYILGPHSQPHLTLMHFHAEESELETLWTKLRTALPQKTLELEFKEFNACTFNNEIYWISLLPNQTEILHKMHAIVLAVLNEKDKRPFEPHMTLINTKEKDLDQHINKHRPSYQPIKDLFRFSLGRCDKHGQFTETLYS